MKRLAYVAALAAISCGGGQTESTERADTVAVTLADEEPRMTLPPHYRVDTESVGGQTWVVEVDRQPADSLRDNTVTLTATWGSRTVISRTFTKADFRDSLEADFYQQSALCGMRLMSASPVGALLAVSVGDPYGDMCATFALTVAPNGAVSYVAEDFTDME